MNYEKKDSDYYSNVRHDLISLIDESKKGLKVLEIGAAYGATLYHLKSCKIAEEVVGIDLFEDAKNKDKYLPLDTFIFGNIESLDISKYDNYFDIVILADVLEHLIEPKIALEKIYKTAKPNGEILVSMPNVRHYSVLNQVFLKGDFKYEESGILDYTHYRFYCKKNIIALLESSGLITQQIVSSIRVYKGKSISKIINKLTFGIFEEFFSVQYLYKGLKK
jgi:2-polyprenyl-3-methyl-5-hydroxy-6-metoxy-1,4-benzoquinol methylase